MGAGQLRRALVRSDAADGAVCRAVCVGMLFGVVGFFSWGCGREKPQASREAVTKPAPVSVSADTLVGGGNVPSPGVPQAANSNDASPATDEPTGEVSLEALNKALRQFLEVSPNVPEDLAELYRARLIPKIPVAPVGKKYVVDKRKARVTLADQ